MTSVGGAKWCKDGKNTISEVTFLLALVGKCFLKPQAVLAASIKAYTLKKRKPRLFIPWTDELENQKTDGIKAISVSAAGSMLA